MNEVIRTIIERRSVRHFRNEAIEPGLLDQILTAAMAAPTAINAQPWAFVLVDQPGLLATLGEVLVNGRMLATAAAAIIVCGDLGRTLPGDDSDYWIQDCSAATQNILLAAHSLGLGAVWVGVYPHQDRVSAVSGTVRLPGHIIPLSVVALGHPLGVELPKEKFKARNIHRNGW